MYDFENLNQDLLDFIVAVAMDPENHMPEFDAKMRDGLMELFTFLKLANFLGPGGSFHPSPPEKCDLCHCKLEDFYIDGRLDGGLMWGNLCSECFIEKGVGIGVGFGQIYGQSEEGWSLVGGYPSNHSNEDSE
jgi:hypothetical protein